MRITFICLGVTLALSVGACGDDESPDRISVVATTSVAADIVANVAGPEVEVSQLVPDGSDPHSYSLSAQEQATLADADLVVYFHPRLEAALPLEEAERSFALGGAGEQAEDPHIWLDPTLVVAALPGLAAELGSVDPANAAAYERRAEQYRAELEGLDRELRGLVAEIPPANRKLVSSHDLLGYFAERYGFEVTGAVFGVAPEAEASASATAGLLEVVDRSGVPAVFAQQGDDPEVLEQLAEQAGVEVVDDLLLESLGPEGPTYVEMMRYSTGRIADALGG